MVTKSGNVTIVPRNKRVIQSQITIFLTLYLVTLDPEEFPKGDSTDYLLEAAPGKKDEVDDVIIFCIDVSGSMCVTTEVTGDSKIKLNSSLRTELSQFIEGNASMISNLFLK